MPANAFDKQACVCMCICVQYILRVPSIQVSAKVSGGYNKYTCIRSQPCAVDDGKCVALTNHKCMLRLVVVRHIAMVRRLPFTSSNIQVLVIQSPTTRHRIFWNACIQLVPLKLSWVDQDLQQHQTQIEMHRMFGCSS